jgi:type IV pilus assembly protein PilO
MDLKLTNVPWYAQVGAAVAIAGLGYGLFYYYYEMGTSAANATKQAQLNTLTADNARAEARARMLPEFEKELADQNARLATLKTALPDEKDAGELLRGLQDLAVRSNLTIKSFRPQPTVPRQIRPPAPTPARGGAAAPPAAPPDYSEWPIALELEGTYHNLALFFDRVGKMERVINISGLDMKTHPMPESNATIVATCTATTFVLLEQPAPPAGRGAAPAGAAGGGRGA